MAGTGILFIVGAVYCERRARLKRVATEVLHRVKGAVITGGRSPDSSIVRRFTADCDVCVAADSGLEAALAAGIVPDYAVGDMDSISDQALLDRLPRDRVRRLPRDKDWTDTELALRLLEELGCHGKILIGGSGGRLDHLFALRALFERESPPSIWVGDESLVIGIGRGFPRMGIRLDSLDAESTISVFPCGTGPHRCVGRGLLWPVDRLDWDGGAFSLSNRSEGGACALDATEGSFLVILPADASIPFAL